MDSEESLQPEAKKFKAAAEENEPNTLDEEESNIV
jgi:hypothetical protein